MSMDMPFLRAENIHKFYGSVHALKGVTLDIWKGEVVGLIGDNGAGKSTLAGIIAGAIPKTAGTIYIKGREVEIGSVQVARQYGIEMVYQDHAVVDTLEVAKNIFLGRELVKPGIIKILDIEKMRREAEKALKSLELRVPPDREVKFLSGGERQGVAISRAMYFRAELVILDEPTAALSVSAARKVLDFVRQLKASNIACIIISHNLYHVYPVADRMVVLSRGEKIADIKKEETSIEELEEILITGKIRNKNASS
ncbi:MAG: ATP-binding cassette domain-containing protein [Nitrososphaerota archaeon]|nr:ATP-binding cassette domain-containing protein [Nitrososphaerota archaeon]